MSLKHKALKVIHPFLVFSSLTLLPPSENWQLWWHGLAAALAQKGSARWTLAQSLGRWGSGFLFLQCHTLSPVENDTDFTLTKFTSELIGLLITYSYCSSNLRPSVQHCNIATSENKQVGRLKSWERMWLLWIVMSLFDYVRVSEMASGCQQSWSGCLWCHMSAYLIVCPHVQHYRQALLRRHSTTGGVEGQFSHWDAHAIAAQIPQA